jgi:hypothetical protein
VEKAVDQVLVDGHRTADIAKSGETPVGTAQMGDLVVNHI